MSDGGKIPSSDDDLKDSEGVASPSELDGESQLYEVLRLIADTQRRMAAGTQGSRGMNKSKVLSSIKLPEFDGAVTTSTRRYREWRKGLEVIRTMNELTDTELAMLIYSQVTGRAKTLIELLEPEELKSAQALDTIFRLYDEAFETMSHEKTDLAWSAWENASRKHGQPMADWCIYLKKIKLELACQDSASTLSDVAVASKLLRGARLEPQKKTQVLFNAGGIYNSEKIETVLKVSFPKIQDVEKRLGQVLPMRKPGKGDGKHSSSWRRTKAYVTEEVDAEEEGEIGEDPE